MYYIQPLGDAYGPIIYVGYSTSKILLANVLIKSSLKKGEDVGLSLIFTVSLSKTRLQCYKILARLINLHRRKQP